MKDDDPFELARFLTAQAPVYEQALAELRAGRKRTHWMWFIFPQFIGLGVSATSRRYAIRSLAEAKAYLEHPLLGARLRECTRAACAAPGDLSAREILGQPDDAKLRSSMTLFAQLPGAPPEFQDALVRFFAGKLDPLTLELLDRPGQRPA